MLEKLKDIVYTIKDTIYGYWYAITHLKDDDDEDVDRWYPGIDRDRILGDNDFERRAPVAGEFTPRNGERPYNWANERYYSHASSNSSRSASSSQADYKTDYRSCHKHGKGTVFYDLKKHFECPKCVEEREKVQIIDFLTESDMQL